MRLNQENANKIKVYLQIKSIKNDADFLLIILELVFASIRAQVLFEQVIKKDLRKINDSNLS